MHLYEHKRRTEEVVGNPCTNVHVYLDQYFKYFRTEAHRIVLHHQKGAHKVAHKFGSEYGYELAYKAASLHIIDDFGFMLADWDATCPHILFLNSNEVDDANHFLYLEFEAKLKSSPNLYY